MVLRPPPPRVLPPPLCCLLLVTQLPLLGSLFQIPYLQGQPPPGLLWFVLGTSYPLTFLQSFLISLLLPSQKHIKVFIYFFPTVVCLLPSLVPDMW